MDSLFLLEDGARAAYLQHLMRSLRCTYICIWSFIPQPTNCLVSMAGFYNDKHVQLAGASNSAGHSLDRRLYDYRQFIFGLETDHVPGLAFKNGIPYMDLKEVELHKLVSVDSQFQFYQDANIKRAVFMGCKAGEIELGFSCDHYQVNLETELKNLVREDFWQRTPALHLSQTLPSSSSSSLHSLSMDSSECFPLLFTMPNTSSIIDFTKSSSHIYEPTVTPLQNTLSPLHQAIMHPYSNNPPLIPMSNENENEAMIQAILAVLSASSSPLNASTSSTTPDVGISYPLGQNDSISAFKRFSSSLGSGTLLGATRGITFKRQNMVKKSIDFFRALHTMRIRPNATQMHHMISERKRREKLNDSFDALRSLLPPGTKKDKASVLKSTTESLASLKAQVADLTNTIQNLESQIPRERCSREESLCMPSNQRLHVRITNLPEATSHERIVDLQVLVRGDINNLDLAIRVLELLKQAKNIEMIYMEADKLNIINRVVLRMKIEDGEWDQSSFQEAVRRVVADLIQ